MMRWGRQVALSIATLLSCIGSARADTLSLLVENDSFFSSSDRDYTSGVELDWSSPVDAGWARKIPLLRSVDQVSIQRDLGQLMFTPMSYQSTAPLPDQHPYAGWLYGGLGITEANDRGQAHLAVELGLTGPLAQGEELQKWFHSIQGLPKPEGWRFQLHTEPAFAIFFDRGVRFAPFGDFFEMAPYYGAAVGTLYDYLHAGGSVRLGFNLAGSYVPLRIEPALPGADDFSGAFGAFLFAGADSRYVARDLFLDGNSFESSAHIPKERLVNVLQVGGAVFVKDLKLSFTHVYQSKEFRAQPVADQFSSINLSLHW